MRIAAIGILVAGLVGCNQNAETLTDDEVLVASCMDDNHMSKQALELFGPINEEWCKCQLDVIKKTVSVETITQTVTLIRDGKSPHFINAASLIDRKADDEASAAMKAWMPECKPLR